MNTFYLIRHGEKVGEAGNPGLTEKGKIQAEKTADYLKDKNIDKLFSSPYKRAQETAKIINNTLKVGVNLDERLKERMNWGSIAGQTLEEFLKEWEYSNYHRNFKSKAGISSLQAGKDVQNLINEISEEFPDKNIALTTHGGIVCDLLRNIYPEDELRKFKQDFPEKLDKLIKECSVTILTKNDNSLVLKELGYIKHLLFPIK